jgi:RNA polymerase sigma factor (TIGR02999 family)
MSTLTSQSVTAWLRKWHDGDESALNDLTGLIYEDLHRLARNYLRAERPDHTLQATALVHEAYLELRELQQVEWKNRSQLIGVIAQVMRHILVDHARQRGAQKRGGGASKLPISRADRVAAADSQIDLVELSDALDKLAGASARSRRMAKAVELFYFGGLSVAEIAEVLSNEGTPIKPATIEKDLQNARAWLYRALNDERCQQNAKN